MFPLSLPYYLQCHVMNLIVAWTPVLLKMVAGNNLEV